MLAARCRQLGAVPVVSAVVPDDPDALAAELRRAAAPGRPGPGHRRVKPGARRPRRRRARPGRRRRRGRRRGPPRSSGAARPRQAAGGGHGHRPHADHRAGIAPVIGLPGYPLATAVIFELFAAPHARGAHRAGPARGRSARGSTVTGPPPPTSRTGCWSRWRRTTRAVSPCHAGQARRGLDQPARPRRRVVAGPGRPGRVHGRHPGRGHPAPRRLTAPTGWRAGDLGGRGAGGGRVHAVRTGRDGDRTIGADAAQGQPGWPLPGPDSLCLAGDHPFHLCASGPEGYPLLVHGPIGTALLVRWAHGPSSYWLKRPEGQVPNGAAV